MRWFQCCSQYHLHTARSDRAEAEAEVVEAAVEVEADGDAPAAEGPLKGVKALVLTILAEDGMQEVSWWHWNGTMNNRPITLSMVA
jgi:hypothetical protein